MEDVTRWARGERVIVHSDSSQYHASISKTINESSPSLDRLDYVIAETAKTYPESRQESADCRRHALGNFFGKTIIWQNDQSFDWEQVACFKGALELRLIGQGKNRTHNQLGGILFSAMRGSWTNWRICTIQTRSLRNRNRWFSSPMWDSHHLDQAIASSFCCYCVGPFLVKMTRNYQVRRKWETASFYIRNQQPDPAWNIRSQ